MLHNKTNNNNQHKSALESLINLNGTMAILEKENGLHDLDFECTEKGVRIEPYEGKFKVQILRNACILITELKKRVRNKPIFREDHSSLSLGVDGKYYFYFSLPAELVDELPERLAHEALTIAQKVVNEILYANVEEVL